ncbi:MAG: hypothetical protein LPK09_10385 [Hymenobacteraceae bacterium]|nr:hypothetical protein [Hymenobacteraceae bacterium]
MKRYSIHSKMILLAVAGALLALWGCEQVEEDVIPISFQEFKLYPDELYMINLNDVELGWGTERRKIVLTPMVNYSLKSKATLTYGQPKNGKLSTDCWGQAGSTCYQPNDGFYGTDSLTYTVCSDQVCKTETIRIHVERVPDPGNCVKSLGADFLETSVNTPGEIKIFANDEFCDQLPYAPVIQNPEHGTIRFYDYMGSYKNTTFIYYPKKNFVGEDSFTYRVHWFGQDAEDVRVKITVKAK